MNGIGERLKLARKMARMSQQELADHAGITKMAISKYENNQMMPGSDILLNLAKALGIRMEFLLRQAPTLEFEPVYRKHGIMQRKSQDAVVAAIQEWLERYLAIEAFFPEEECNEFAYPEGFPYPVKSLIDAEEAAGLLRERWELGIDAIEDLTELLEARGIKVGSVHADPTFLACTFWVNEDMPVIATNQIGPGDRQRFGLAHELGHLVMDVDPDVDEEKAANRFAGAFLVSPQAALMELGHSRSSIDPFELYLLKHKYGMSMGAWLHRAEELGILPESAERQLWEQFVQKGWKQQEPLDQVKVEQPTRMFRLVRRLIAEDIISRSRSSELLGDRVDLFADKELEALALHS